MSPRTCAVCQAEFAHHNVRRSKRDPRLCSRCYRQAHDEEAQRDADAQLDADADHERFVRQNHMTEKKR